ncbi:MFS transporter, PAT family, beta-lactamase induction signal transducer AmpG [Saccharicrinis carchari]|uniref:MFS transporter, PAT family, beta-lactamase induction signal transducer AmpG n=1 Tax=Saccharicrinis carchari TaxID=1168039 RepID=A0A521CXZ1_SACCC|nr:MFS transporter [Saccharicrinis carchari]SMO64298.1 MFS transporter, PAT family, beta-lactamase induction signal transducer AmpG [Saccharicrinis carchari]
MTRKNFDIEPRKINPGLWIPSVYFAMGLPFIAIAQASALMYESMGVSDSQIAFWTSLIMIPYTLKFLWSPVLEMFKTKKHFVVATQIVTGMTFALVALSLPLENYFRYSIALLGLIAISGATHDIATDGVYLSVLSPKLQARFIGWQGAAYNVAKLVSGGGFVYLAGELEETMGITTAWMVVMGIYGAVMFLLGLYHIKMLPGGGQATEVQSLKEGFETLWDVLRTFFQKKYILWYIMFIILYRFAEGFAIKMVPLFFKAAVADGGLGMTTKQIGLVYGAFGSVAFVIGSLLGGYYIASRGLKNVLFKLALVFNVPYAVYIYLSYYQPDSLFLITTAVVVEYLSYGFGFVGLMLFMMQQIAPGKYKMAHYAFATGIMNLGVMIPSMGSGYLSDLLGYNIFFIWVMIATIPSLLVAYFVPFTYPDADKEDQ